MTVLKMVSQAWILIPVLVLMVTGFALTLRSVDVPSGHSVGVRQMAGNLTTTAIYFALCLVLLLFLQSIAGFHLDIFR